MKIIVVGTGYVGLVSGACLADVGMNVVCIDTNTDKIDKLNKLIIPIHEPGLDDIVSRNKQSGRLKFSTKLEDHIDGADAVFIAVGTPPREDGSANLNYVEKVADQIGEYMSDYLVVVTKSTVPVGTSKMVSEKILNRLDDRGAQLTFDVASNPEFLKEGAAIKDFMSPDRIIIGVESERAKEVLERIYKPFQLNGYRIIYMDITSSELTKYAANAMLATRISFMNEMANLCENVGANINHIRNGIGSDPRIGNKFLYSGVGYGGSCFPKDVKAIINTAKTFDQDLKILKAVEDVNQNQKIFLTRKVISEFGEDLTGRTFAIWGLSFKPNTDDMREAPSLTIIQSLIDLGARVKAYDPVAISETKKLFPENDSIDYTDNAYDALKNSDALLLITEWNEFRSPDWDKVKLLLTNPIVFDGRNIYDKEFLLEEGFKYYGIGIIS